MTQHKLTTDFVATLQDISLRTWQARTASTIGIKSGQKQADFLRNELERIELVSKAAIDKAADAQAAIDDLLAALEDAEFLLRKIAINPAEAWAMQDSFARSAQDARDAIAKAQGG